MAATQYRYVWEVFHSGLRPVLFEPSSAPQDSTPSPRRMSQELKLWYLLLLW